MNSELEKFMSWIPINREYLFKYSWYEDGADVYTVALHSNIFIHNWIFFVPYFHDELISLYKPTYNEEEDLNYIKNIFWIDMYDETPWNSERFYGSTSFLTHFGKVVLHPEYDDEREDEITYITNNTL